MRTWSRDETLVEFFSHENEPLSGLGAGIEKKKFHKYQKNVQNLAYFHIFEE